MGKGKKRPMVAAMLVVVAMLGLGGCGAVRFEKTPTAPFEIALAIDGDVPVGTFHAGPLEIPVSEAFATTIMRLAKPYLIESGQFESCHYTSFPEAKEETAASDLIVVTATAACTLKGEVYNEKLTLTLTPVKPEA